MDIFPYTAYVTFWKLRDTLSWWTRHSKSRFCCAVKTLVLKFCARKSGKISKKNHLTCVKHEEKSCKEVILHKFLVCACKSHKSQDFAQSQKIFARSHDRETVIFKNSVMNTLDVHISVTPQSEQIWTGETAQNGYHLGLKKMKV